MENIQSLISEEKKFSKVLVLAGSLGSKSKLDVYAVGGYVRDIIMGRQVQDLDIMVVGDGIEFAKILAKELKIKTVIPFEKFGTAAIPYKDGQIEVASARTETYEEHSRKPVVKMTNLEEDLSRRDFTINALAVSLNDNEIGDLVDPYHGIQDMKEGIIKTPLNPDQTFSDDPLRMLRAVRFAATLKFQLDNPVKYGIKKMSSRLEIISAERITAEFYKILGAKKPSIGLELLHQVGLMDWVFPELTKMINLEQNSKWHHKDIFYHPLQVVDNVADVSDKPDLRFAGLVHDIAKPQTRRLDKVKGWTFHGHEFVGPKMIESVAQRMKLSKKTKEYLQKLTKLHLRPISLAMEGVTDSAVRRVMAEAGEEVDDLMILCRADITSKNPDLVKKYMGNFERVEEFMQNVQEKDAFRAFQSPVRGEQIMKEMELKPGPEVGKIKKQIEEAILDGEIENNFEAAYDYFLKIKSKY